MTTFYVDPEGRTATYLFSPASAACEATSTPPGAVDAYAKAPAQPVRARWRYVAIIAVCLGLLLQWFLSDGTEKPDSQSPENTAYKRTEQPFGASSVDTLQLDTHVVHSSGDRTRHTGQGGWDQGAQGSAGPFPDIRIPERWRPERRARYNARSRARGGSSRRRARR